MGEDTQPLTTEAELRRANRGIVTTMLALAAVGAVLTGIFAGVAAGVGVAIGGVMAWINFRWLDASTRAIMVDPVTATTPFLARSEEHTSELQSH